MKRVLLSESWRGGTGKTRPKRCEHFTAHSLQVRSAAGLLSPSRLKMPGQRGVKSRRLAGGTAFGRQSGDERALCMAATACPAGGAQ